MNSTNKQVARWIWYPGDFEIYLGLKVHSSRYERTTQITPIWRLDTVYPNVKFKKKFTADEEDIVYIHADGTVAIEFDGLGVYYHDYKNGMPVSKGEHEIILTVFNKDTVPSVFIDSKVLITDETWEVTCVDNCWLHADCWKFSSEDTPPSSFHLETKPMEPVFMEKRDKGVFYDFGREFMGYGVLSGVQGEGRVFISYGESRAEALSIDQSELIDIFQIQGDYKTPVSKAFRYLYIECAETVSIGKVSALYEYLPLENRGGFQCDDPRLNAIYQVSLYTLLLNSREFFIDGIKRDRWVWSGDAYQSYLLNYYSYFDKDICKRTMRLIRGKNPVKTHFNTIQEYTLYWFISLYDYYMYTGDSAFIRQNYNNAKTLMDFCNSFVDERGFLLANEKDWVFVDWAPIDNRGDISVIQILFAKAIECMACLSSLCGDTQAHAQYTGQFQKLIPNIFKYFWSRKYQCFTHGLSDSENAVVTKYPNIFALLFGYLSEEQIRNVKAHALLDDSVLNIITPYMKFYEMAALCETGCQTEVGKYIKEYWGGMLDCGATTFWELYDPSMKGDSQYAMYGRSFGKSLCHAWGAGPILLFGRYFLGVKPLSAGYQDFLVAPCLGGFQSISGTVPTPSGPIEVFLDRTRVRVANNTPFLGKLVFQHKEYPIKANDILDIIYVPEVRQAEIAVKAKTK